MAGAWSNYDTAWKQAFKTALVVAGVFEEFWAKKEEIRKRTLGMPGRKDKKTADKWAWKEASEGFNQHFNRTAFDDEYRKALAAGRSEQAVKKSAMAVQAKKRKKSKQENLVLENSDDIDFEFDPEATMDVLADVKWVYINMHKLVKTDSRGLTSLNVAAISKAPSAGAVGMANYALADPKAFYEKYVTRILPKTDETPQAKTMEELQAELDPTFDDISKYMRKLVPQQ